MARKGGKKLKSQKASKVPVDGKLSEKKPGGMLLYVECSETSRSFMVSVDPSISIARLERIIVETHASLYNGAKLQLPLRFKKSMLDPLRVLAAQGGGVVPRVLNSQNELAELPRAMVIAQAFIPHELVFVDGRGQVQAKLSKNGVRCEGNGRKAMAKNTQISSNAGSVAQTCKQGTQAKAQQHGAGEKKPANKKRRKKKNATKTNGKGKKKSAEPAKKTNEQGNKKLAEPAAKKEQIGSAKKRARKRKRTARASNTTTSKKSLKQRLSKYYAKHNPEKATKKNLNLVVNTYKNRQEELCKALRKQYGTPLFEKS